MLGLTFLILMDKIHFGRKADMCEIQIDDSSSLMHLLQNRAKALLYYLQPGSELSMYTLSSGLLDERIPDMAALDLPSRSLRNRLGDDNLFWDLELGNFSLKSLLYPLLFLCIIPAISRLEYYASPNNLALLGVFNAKAYA